MLYILRQKKIIGLAPIINLIEFVTVWVHFRYRTSEAKVQILHIILNFVYDP